MTTMQDPAQDGPLVVAARAMLASGAAVGISDRNGVVAVSALDLLTEATFAALRANGASRLVLTGERASLLGLLKGASAPVAVALPDDASFALVQALFLDAKAPVASIIEAIRASVEPARHAERAALELAKRAGLLPAVLSSSDLTASLMRIGALAVDSHGEREIAGLARIVEARLPIAATEAARIVAFRSPLGATEQVALIIGDPAAHVDDGPPPLVRLHSECMTGDLFSSQRCDCGLQLQGSIAHMVGEGSGIVLYLRQEGRGIGLVNKLRAYQLQDQGYDTIDANMHLGFRPDERDFRVAARMLDLLGVSRIRLLTNNPDKVRVMRQHGVDVVQRVPLVFAANRHNRAYLQAKAQKSGHLLQVIDGGRADEQNDVARELARILREGHPRELGA